MSIITFMLVIIALGLSLLGAAGFLVYKLATKEKPPKDFSNVETPPSFRDAAPDLYNDVSSAAEKDVYDSPPFPARPVEREKN